MALRSMTGFGQAEAATPSGTYRVEIRAVNNRYLEIQMRTPRPFANIETHLKKILSDRVCRGSITLMIAWEKGGGETRLTWDKAVVENYIAAFRQIRDAYKLSGDITLANLQSIGDFIKTESVQHDEKILLKHVSPILESALVEFNKSRETEAAFIAKDMKKMVKDMERLLGRIMKRAPIRLKEYSGTLVRKIESLVSGNVDAARLATEVALMADRLDISEECTRLQAHISKFITDFDSTDQAGKRMSFVLQEMNRESSTIASKANDTEIGHLSIELREIIEKLREQVQNIE
jgi:uncharacterized protein (TIGR00255 family)